MAALFDCTVANVNKHLKAIFEAGELDEDSVIEEFSITAADGKNYKTKHYNLDAVISVGYRINSLRATQFRQWATKVLNAFTRLDYATRQARRHIPMSMEDWATKLDAFLQFNDEEILQGKGSVTHAIAKAFAESEFEKYRVIQDREYRSDFDVMMQQFLFEEGSANDGEAE